MSCKDVCMAVDYDADFSEFYRAAVRRAAKDHRCEECGCVIAKGEQYEYASAKTDGDFRTTAVLADYENWCCEKVDEVTVTVSDYVPAESVGADS